MRRDFRMNSTSISSSYTAYFRRACVTLAIALTVYPFYAYGADATPPGAGVGAGPRISCDDAMFDFGTVVNTKPIEHTFVLKNVGSAPLEISGTSTACGCTVAKMDTKSLAPGKTTKLEAKLDLAGKTGVISKAIFVRTNDTSQPQGMLTLTLKGTAAALITVDHPMISWGVVSKDTEETKAITVQTAMPDVTFKITGIDVTSSNPTMGSSSAATPNEAANVKPKLATQVDTIQEGKQYRVTVKTVPPLPEGFLASELHIHTDHPDYPDILVQVVGTILGEVGVMPAVVDVPAPGSNAMPISRYVRIVPGTVKEFKVLKVRTPFFSIIPVVNLQPGNVVLIRLENIVPSPELDGKTVTVTTDVPGRKEISIPFKVRAAPVTPVERRPLVPFTPGEQRPPAPAEQLGKAPSPGTAQAPSTPPEGK